MFKFEFTDTWSKETNKMLADFGLEDHGRVQKAVDKAVIDYMMPYWAWDTGNLARSAYNATDIGSGIVIYPGPYAHYMYYGEIYGPNFPTEIDEDGNVLQWRSPAGQKKHPTGRFMKYKKDANPKAGWFPFQRMMVEHGDDILEEARKVVRDK